jgi:hypothetical protein
MINLKELFKQRDEEYAKITEIILSELSHATEAALEFIPDDTAKYVNWKTAEHTGDFILIIGVQKFPVGYNLRLESGEEVTVTDESQDMLQRIFRVYAPYDLIATKDKERVKQFLRDHVDFGYAEEESETIETPEAQTELSVEQQQILWHSTNANRGRVN